MCGICGFVSRERVSLDELKEMNNTLVHRGPDDSGEEIYELSGGWGVGMAHRRLSIIDLSDCGHQPMHSNNDEVIVVFNGEIYNFEDLRNELSDYHFSSRSDTEVIIAAYQRWGTKFVERIEGMFSIALLDRKAECLYLIRDRIGKKPLYYYVDKNNNVYYASELKAIMTLKCFDKRINKEIIGRYLYRSYITHPDTIFEGVYKLEPGMILTVSGGELLKFKYWDIASKHIELASLGVDDYEIAKNDLKELIAESVKKRMVADVKVGAFLSGGYDSTLICALAQEQSVKPIETFSIGFCEKEYNEANYAKKIARHIGTNHHEKYITEEDLLDYIDIIPKVYDEPFADASQIPTMIVSKMAKEEVTVVLSGDGGDELFGGYNIYSILRHVQNVEEEKENIADQPPIVDRIIKDNLCNAKTQGGVKSYVDAINRILITESDKYYYANESKYSENLLDIRRMLIDLDTFMPEDILTKVDRASMNYSLECRCPLLSKNVIEYSFGLSHRMKIDKKILKDITYMYVPKELLDRPKMGFGIPRDKWLRTVLKERLMEWSEERFLNRQDIFIPNELNKLISHYLNTGDKEKFSGKNFSTIIWNYYMFQQWYENYITG